MVNIEGRRIRRRRHRPNTDGQKHRNTGKTTLRSEKRTERCPGNNRGRRYRRMETETTKHGQQPWQRCQTKTIGQCRMAELETNTERTTTSRMDRKPNRRPDGPNERPNYRQWPNGDDIGQTRPDNAWQRRLRSVKPPNRGVRRGSQTGQSTNIQIGGRTNNDNVQTQSNRGKQRIQGWSHRRAEQKQRWWQRNGQMAELLQRRTNGRIGGRTVTKRQKWTTMMMDGQGRKAAAKPRVE